MDYALIAAVAFAASGLTLFSGFGLGTVLLPVFALFFPVPQAIAATAVVHLLNNVFKAGLVGRKADWPTVLRFGLPAVPAAVAGTWLLVRLEAGARLYEWTLGARTFGPTAAGFTVGVLLAGMALLELQPWFQRLAAPARLLPLGGLVTGFIGGLTGQQGAFRAIFLLKSGLEPSRLIATGVMLAILIDLSRIPAYALAFAASGAHDGREWRLVAVGALAAFAGAALGARYLDKVTIGLVRLVVAVMMLGIGGALMAGLVG